MNSSISSRARRPLKGQVSRRFSKQYLTKTRKLLNSSKPRKKRAGSESAASMLVMRLHASNSLVWQLQARSDLFQVQVQVELQYAPGVLACDRNGGHMLAKGLLSMISALSQRVPCLDDEDFICDTILGYHELKCWEVICY